MPRMMPDSLDDYPIFIRSLYAQRTERTACTKLLDEFCEIAGFERKYAIKVLGGQRRPMQPEQILWDRESENLGRLLLQNELFPFRARNLNQTSIDLLAMVNGEGITTRIQTLISHGRVARFEKRGNQLLERCRQMAMR